MSLDLLKPQKLLHSKERFFILLCLILGLIILVPILNRFTAARIFLDIFLTAIFISMAYVISPKKGFVIAGVLLVVLMLGAFWLQYFIQNKAIAAFGMITGVFFIGLVISSILSSRVQIGSDQPGDHLYGHPVVSSGSTYVGIPLYFFGVGRSGIIQYRP